MPVISIIVPVYKTKEEYLRKCIESLRDQTFKDIEIVLVDDGTPDNGGIICDAYAEKDSRIKVIHQKNQGVSIARNNGMKKADGQWIMFVDADDWIDKTTCEILYKNILEHEGIEILFFSLKVTFPNKEVNNPFWDNEKQYLDLQSREELQLQILHKAVSRFVPPYNMVGVAVCKLYNLDFLRKNNMEFNSNLPLSEDGVFMFWVLEKANKIMYLDEYFYHYRRHEESATSTFRPNAIEDYQVGLNEFDDIFMRLSKDNRYFKALYYRALINFFSICNQLYCNDKNKKSFFKKVKGINRLSKSKIYRKAIKNISFKEYLNNGSRTQSIGFAFVKLKMFTLLYLFLKLKSKRKLFF